MVGVCYRIRIITSVTGAHPTRVSLPLSPFLSPFLACSCSSRAIYFMLMWLQPLMLPLSGARVYSRLNLFWKIGHLVRVLSLSHTKKKRFLLLSFLLCPFSSIEKADKYSGVNL